MDGDRCPVTGARFFGAALVQLLTDEAVFAAARKLTIAGDQGLCLIEFSDGRDSRWAATGRAFQPERAIERLRSLEVQRLRKVFDILARTKGDAKPAASRGEKR